ncbi:DUF4038 domain-containing protein [Nocardioides koreensis]|uniref:apiosidase-like domain-containing protein n=1 Tax=Nocardioides koreensis TaxID=433651 RepID=UPI0031D3801E
MKKVSRNGRYFVDQAGDPILVKGDSPWAILVDASTAQMDSYVATRAKQGFNAALVSLLGNVANGGPSNSGATYDGVLPFVHGNPGRLNDRYWDRVGHFIRKCRHAGITVMAYPLDGWTGTTDYSGLAQDWSNAQARAYGKAVAARLSRYPNVIWAVGGDYNGVDPAVNARSNAVLKGLAAGGMNRLSTIQLTLNQTSYDVDYWAKRIDFSFVYSYAATYTMMESGYRQTTPAGDHLPAIMGETHYESYQGVTDLYLRSQAAWALTSGAAGEFYGSEDVWDAAPTSRNLRTTAVSQLSALRKAFGKLNGWQRLVPDYSSHFITGGRGTKGDASGEYVSGDTYVTGAITRDGTLAVVYVPSATSQTITLDTSQMGRGYTARWIDPTNGARVAAPTGTSYTKSGANAAGGPDWLLVLRSDHRR